MNQRLYKQVHDHIKRVMSTIERKPVGFLKHPFLATCHGDIYAAHGIWLWDSHHMSMRFANDGQPEYLRHHIDIFLEYQAADGFTPNVILKGSIAYAQAHALPFMMQSAFLYFALTGDLAWAKSVYPRLKNYLAYYGRTSLTRVGLFRWSAMGSGMDNDVAHTFFRPETVITPDINAWLYLEYRAAAKLAHAIGEVREAKEWSRKASALAKAVNDLLWNDPCDSFSAYDLVNGKFIFCFDDPYLDNTVGRYSFQSGSNLIPLCARIADRRRARRMIDRYLLSEEHFWSEFGVRSLSRSSEYYSNAVWGSPSRYHDFHRLTNSNWQGPIWILLCYWVMHGLEHYGYSREAGALAERTIRVLAMSLDKIGSFTENFDAETGAPLFAPAFASWSILADLMPIELRTGKWIMDPVFAPGP
jgi:putative isomerase